MITRAFYLRIAPHELQRFIDKPELVRKLDLRVALTNGRAIDLGRRWEELGCLLEGGFTRPNSAPSMGDIEILALESQVWSFVTPERVKSLAPKLSRINRAEFYGMYHVDDDESQDRLPHEWTGTTESHADYLFKKLEQLAAHYRAAADAGEAMLVEVREHKPAP